MPHMVTFLKPQPIDERTGNFDALNETTNVRPVKGESISIVHPEFRTGLINPDSMRPVDFGSFEPLEVKSVEDGKPAEPEIGGLKGGQEGEELLPTDADLNDVVIGVKEKVGGTFAFETGLPVEGLHDSVHCITDGCGQNVPFGSRFPTDNVSGTSGLGGTTFMTETFEPMEAMTSFAGTFNVIQGDLPMEADPEVVASDNGLTAI